MKELIKEIYKKYFDIIPYAVFGVLTTVVNIVVYRIFSIIIKSNVIIPTIIAWIVAVLFAFITNRKWVFHSKATTKISYVKEIFNFYICRLATGGIDVLCMWYFVDVLRYNDMVIKIIANIIVIVLNYIASKLWIFKKR